MFAVIEFSEKNDTGLAVVPKKWICPEENLCMWPPTTGATSSGIRIFFFFVNDQDMKSQAKQKKKQL